ncbi:hypothetical protein [Paenibacillus taichungensis]
MVVSPVPHHFVDPKHSKVEAKTAPIPPILPQPRKKSTAMRERFQISVHYNGIYIENILFIWCIWNLGINLMQLIWLKKEEYAFTNGINMIIQNHNALPFMDIKGFPALMPMTGSQHRDEYLGLVL